MKFQLWRKKGQTSERLDEIEREATQVHQKNISNIRKSRVPVDKLNVELKRNNIVFQLASVIGHK